MELESFLLKACLQVTRNSDNQIIILFIIMLYRTLRNYGICVFVAAVASYPYLIDSAFNLFSRLSPAIENNAEAHRIKEEEKSKLGIEGKVHLFISGENILSRLDTSGFCKIDHQGFSTIIDISDLRRMNIMREMYRIKKRWCFDGLSGKIENAANAVFQKRSDINNIGERLREIYIENPVVNIYGVTGLQL